MAELPPPDTSTLTLLPPPLPALIEVPDFQPVRPTVQEAPTEMIVIPYERDREGNFIDKLDDKERLSFGPTIEDLRSRFSKPELIDEAESDVLLRQVADYSVAAVKGLDADIGKFLNSENRGMLHFTHIRHKPGSGDNSVLVLDSNESILNIDPHNIDEYSEVLAQVEGIEWKHPADAKIANYINVFAHENGHLVARSFAKSLGIGEWGSSKDFFAALLSEKTELGFTGIFQSDPQIMDERFANGLSDRVVGYIFSHLGYTTQEITLITKTLNGYDYEYSDNGHRQIDAIEHARERNISIGKAALGLAGIKSDHLAYEGGLGYRSPLDNEELVMVLRFAQEHIQTGTRPTTLGTEDYRKKFDETFGGSLHPKVKARLEDA